MGKKLKPFPRYTSLRKFKKAYPYPYSSKGWSVWDEIDAQREYNREIAECGYDEEKYWYKKAYETL